MSRAKSHQFWAATGEPMRPMAVRPEYLENHGTHSTEPGNAAIGRCTDPPPGVEREAWQAMDYEEQVRVRAEVYSQAADDQLAWEEKARREYEERRASDASS